jgi:hypothetical protein
MSTAPENFCTSLSDDELYAEVSRRLVASAEAAGVESLTIGVGGGKLLGGGGLIDILRNLPNLIKTFQEAWPLIQQLLELLKAFNKPAA